MIRSSVRGPLEDDPIDWGIHAITKSVIKNIEVNKIDFLTSFKNTSLP
jgi:hypothetical protein